VVKSGAAGTNRESYLKFDLSSVSTINSVKLRLFGKLSSTENTNVVTGVFAVPVTTWTEGGINFNNRPASAAVPLATATIIDTNTRFYEFDVTAYVKAEKAAGRNTVSFALRNPLATNAAVIFNSDEAPANRPQLAIS
jgi:hypothetical protein